VVRHIITGEFPPDVGGVAGYTAVVAEALAEAGDEIHVWTAGREGVRRLGDRVTVHRSLGTFDGRSLAAADADLERFPSPRRLLLQWVPHAYGLSSVNVGFCFWMRRRVRRHGDVLDVMVHEPFLRFGGSLRQTAAAAAHRLMIGVLLGAASRVYVPAAAWEKLCRPYAKRLPFTWMPIPSGIADTAGEDAPAAVRASLALAPQATLIGSFGRAGAAQRRGLAAAMTAMERDRLPAVLLLIGAGGEAVRKSLAAEHPHLAGRIQATGVVPPKDVSRYLRACDLLVQPYPDGICGRHSSAMAGLVHGRAIVTTDGDVTEPVWRESGAVRLAPAGNWKQLAEAVRAVAGDREARATLGARARDLYEQRFDVRHTVAALRA
jgi:glycosyltransferase involved in cell wall biosynthesis